MRKLALLVAAVLAATSVPACTVAEGSEDPDFDKDFLDDFENDDEEAAAEDAEATELDDLDDLDDVEDSELPVEGGDPIFEPDPGDPGGEGGDAGDPGDPGGEGGDAGDPGDPGGDPGAEGEGAATPPKTRPRRGPHGPLSIIEDDPNFSGFAGYDGSGAKIYDPVKAGERLDQAKALGADVVRVMLWWHERVPGDWKSKTKPGGFVSSKPDAYDWRAFDMQVSQARARGLKVMVTIPAGPMPYWASEEPEVCEKKGGWSCAWKPKYREYAAWVAAVGRHVKAKGYRIWAWTFVNEPNIGAFLQDETSKRTAHRYRKLWFHARKALRKTAGVKARVFFSDQANNQKSLEPDATRWSLLNMALCLELDRDPEVIPGFCPEKKRIVDAAGVAFHPYASAPKTAKRTVDFLQKLVDEAAEAGRIRKNRGLYMTESAFLTARAADAGKLGAATLSVTPAQQAVYMNKADRLLSSNPRVKSLAQYELIDEGRGTWDCGLRYALGTVNLKAGGSVTGDFLEVRIGRHVVVQPSGGTPQTILWTDIAGADSGSPQFWGVDQGSEKPAYAAYRIAIDVVKQGSDVEVWGLARADTGAGFTLEGLTPSGWLEIKIVKTDALGYGKATVPIGTATAWRIRFGGEISREAR